MDFSQQITDYKDNASEISSPIWIWFSKKEKKEVVCQICKTNIQRRDFSTGQMTQHLQRHHNFLKKYNAYKEFEELSALKQERMQNRKRKNEATEDEQPKKQQKIEDCKNKKFSRDHPRQVEINNAIGLYLCADAQPTHTVSREGFKNVMKTAEPRYTLPHYNTFARTIIPKLKNNVTES